MEGGRESETLLPLQFPLLTEIGFLPWPFIGSSLASLNALLFSLTKEEENWLNRPFGNDLLFSLTKEEEIG